MSADWPRGLIILIIFFAVLTMFVWGAIENNRDPNSEGLKLTERTAAASPFVIAIKTAGIKGLPSLINACLLTSGACTSTMGSPSLLVTIA